MSDVMKIVGTDGNVRYAIDGTNQVIDLHHQHLTDGEHPVCLTCGNTLSDEEFQNAQQQRPNTEIR